LRGTTVPKQSQWGWLEWGLPRFARN